MYRYIKNPKTNENHHINSIQGLKILKNYINQTGGGRCSECNKVANKNCTCKIKNLKLVIKPKRQPKITQIKGPISLFLWDIKCPNNTNKKILLLGDEHTLINDTCVNSNKNCDNIDIFLEKIITRANKKNKCIDIFLEEKQKKKSAPLYLKGGEFTKNYKLLNQIKHTFYNCSWHAGFKSKAGKKCTHKNLRFHNFDLRFSNDKKGSHRTSNKLDLILYNSKNPTGYNHNRDYSLMADYILGSTIKSKDMKRLNKLIEALTSSVSNINTPSYTKNYSVSEIKKEMTTFRRLVKKEYRKYLKTKNEYIPRKNRKLRSCLKNIINEKYKITGEFYEYTHLFVDLYTLSRIFMEFSTDKNKTSRGPGKCSILENGNKTINISPNKVIIIAGGDHINVYNEVLEYYFPNSLVYKTKNTKFNKHIKRQDILPKLNSFDDLIEKFIE